LRILGSGGDPVPADRAGGARGGGASDFGRECGVSIVEFVVVLAGGGEILGAVRDAWRGAGTRGCSTAPGRILACEVTDDGDDEGKSYAAEIAYGFAVAGGHHVGDRVRYGRSTGLWRRKSAEAIAARYPVGTAVNVAYDPLDPGRCVLEPGVHVGDCLTRAVYGAVGCAIVTAFTVLR
jgi:hypothetical protein